MSVNDSKTEMICFGSLYFFILDILSLSSLKKVLFISYFGLSRY